MGGKVAMKLTELAAERLEQLVILDIAPFAYQENHHDHKTWDEEYNELIEKYGFQRFKD